MIVAFNSMNPESEEALNNMLVVALAMIQERDIRLVLVQGEFGNYRLQEALGGCKEQLVREPYAYMDGVGMDYLLKRSRFDMLDERSVTDGVVQACEGLAYVPGAVRKSRPGYEYEWERECRNILQQLEKVADYVFVDCSNVSGEAGRQIQKQADLIVMNLVQSKKVLDEYFMLPAAYPYHYKTIFCIGNYIVEEPYNLKNIQRMYRIDYASLRAIPYNVEFLSAIKRGRAIKFFEHRFVYSRSLENQKFFHAAFRAAESIVDWEEQKYGH